MAPRELVLSSNEQGGSLLVEADSPAAEWWFVTLEVLGLRASAKIDGDPMGIAQPLDAWFASLAEDWRGWDGTRTWESIEGTLRLSATHDQLGTILVRAHLARSAHLDDWTADAALFLDAGGLSAVARAAKQFSAR